MDKKVIATNFGPNNGSGYYETNHYDDVIEITYVSEIDVVLWPGEYANLEHYPESPECDEYNTHDVHEQLGDIAHRLSSADQEELQKCKDSPVYFYNKYVRREGQKELTKVEFEDFVKQVEYQRNRPSNLVGLRYVSLRI